MKEAVGGVRAKAERALILTGGEGAVTTRIRPCTAAVLLLCAASPGAAQERAPASLTLEEALELARTGNPAFGQARNDAALADWDVRAAWGQLMPSANASLGAQWQGAGEQRFGSLTLGDLGFGDQPSYYFSSYNVSLSYALDWATLLGPKQSNAERRSTLAQIDVVEGSLVVEVTSAYVEVLRQDEAVQIAEQQLANAEFNLRLARGQLEVGSVTPIDVGQAEVQVGRAEVAVLQARNDLSTSRIRLLQLLGLPAQEDFEPTTAFELTEPTWELGDLVGMALLANPELVARRSRTDAADVGVSSARSSYFPTLGISTGWSGFSREASSAEFQIRQAQAQVASSIASCVRTNDLYARLADPLPPIDCSRLAFTDEQRNAIIAANDQFPLNFVRSPPSVSFSLSIPIFQGLNRQRNLEAARLQRDDLAHQVREQELAVQADLAIGLANTRTLYQSALLEERNRELADQQLRLARERYQLGAATFIELVEAQTVLAEAEAALIQAIYAYHDAVTGLEALVGTPLRF